MDKCFEVGKCYADGACWKNYSAFFVIMLNYKIDIGIAINGSAKNTFRIIFIMTDLEYHFK